MASTSASSVQKNFKYDVFLSFHGEDTRRGFVDHLYHALQGKGIITYKDDEKIQKGERISEQLIRSIRDSRFYIIVFSKNYASSSWCLDELVKIMECQKMVEHIAYPVFYDVEPTQVQNQSGPVGEAFAKHEKGRWSSVLPLDCLCFIAASCFNGSSFSFTGSIKDLENEDDVGRWRNALKEAAGLAGMELKTTFNGHEAKFIQQIVQEISLRLHFVNSSIDAKLVGMGTRVKNVVSSLETGSDDVRMIGIKGIGGGGKTTLARAVFDLMSVWFEGKSFVENVREISKGPGLKELQKQVLKDVLNDQSINVTSVYDGKILMKRMMPGRKALVVLDDVDSINQLEALVGDLTWFKSGTRIIITTRDEQVLVAHGVNFTHDVNLLSHKEAICLFSRHAFDTEIPGQGYEELSGKVVRYAAGLPLTLKVLGSHLCGRSELDWVDATNRLKNIPLKETTEKLELSYNGLENDQKEIFLDVVCILKGKTKKRAIRILESCGYNAHIGLRVLEQKSLITYSNSNGLGFHDHIEEMGWNIVRCSHPDEPSRHSRLWIKEEIEDILGTKATRSRKMKKLRLLEKNVDFNLFFSEDDEVSQCLYEDDEVSQYLPDTLQSLYWDGYSFWSLPETFQANKLVNLEMPWSKILELWKGGEKKVLKKLRFLDLRCSKLRTLDLGLAPNLEELNLKGCSDFEELYMPVECLSLKVINLGGSKVSHINLAMIPHLEKLNLGGCRDFEELQFPAECLNLKFLNLSGSKVINLNLGMIPHLKELNLNNSKVSSINLGLAPHLERLYLKGCSNLRELHAPVGCLEKVVDFELDSCLNFEYLRVKIVHESTNPDYVATFNIHVDYVMICPVHPKNNLPRFGFHCLDDEPRSTWSRNLEKLISFGPCVCEHVEYISATICDLQHLKELTLNGGIPQDLWRLQSLEKLSLKDQWLQHLQDSICMLKRLKSLQLYACYRLELLPENIGELGCLEELLIQSCKFLRYIPDIICKMKCLKHVRLSFCHNIMKLPEELGSLECLEELLILSCKSLRYIPDSICKMKCLKHLRLNDCHNIMKLPEELGSLERLRVLEIRGTGISDLPRSIYQLKGLTIYYSWGPLSEELESNGYNTFFDYVVL